MLTLDMLQVCRQRVKRSSVGTIGTPRSGSPSARTFLDGASPAGSCSDVEGSFIDFLSHLVCACGTIGPGHLPVTDFPGSAPSHVSSAPRLYLAAFSALLVIIAQPGHRTQAWHCTNTVEPHMLCSVAVGSPTTAGRALKVPDVAVPMQHSLLKRISAFQSKEVRPSLGESCRCICRCSTDSRYPCWGC